MMSDEEYVPYAHIKDLPWSFDLDLNVKFPPDTTPEKWEQFRAMAHAKIDAYVDGELNV